MKQILLVYDLPKESITAVMILYKNMKVMVHSSDGDTDFFDNVIGVLQRLSINNLPRLCTLNINRPHERKWSHMKKGMKQTIPHRNYHGCRLYR